MTKKSKTIKIKGGSEYAKVADRIKMFREDCPNGSIKTTPTFLQDGQVMFNAEVIKDLSNQSSAIATANALGNNKGEKAFEKIESIAVGRALAMLGYCADGEIATSEEMEEFQEYQKTKRDEQIENLKIKIDEIKTIEELREFYKNNKGLGSELDLYITNKSKEFKNENN